MTVVSGSSQQLTLKKGAPGDLLCMQLASYLEGGPLMWLIHLHLYVSQKSYYDDEHLPLCLAFKLHAHTLFSWHLAQNENSHLCFVKSKDNI